jgi:hypothetical protein
MCLCTLSVRLLVMGQSRPCYTYGLQRKFMIVRSGALCLWAPHRILMSYAVTDINTDPEQTP